LPSGNMCQSPVPIDSTDVHQTVIQDCYGAPTQHEEIIMYRMSPVLSNADPALIATLLAEIARLETRVMQLNEGRDSAYEKALIRSYENLLENHRSRLSALAAA
jgi:hypothetical protein